jgi:hypothetical protein
MAQKLAKHIALRRSGRSEQSVVRLNNAMISPMTAISKSFEQNGFL